MQMSLKGIEKFKDLGILAVRFAFGFRLMYGTLDNIISYDQMLEFRDFLEAHGFPLPLASAFVSVGLQFLAGLSFVTGAWIRLFSAFMILNFMIALVMVHMGDSYLNAAPAIHLLVVSFFLFLNGAGKWSVTD